uniref:Putative secreted protein n=1 Tax=Anopheles darlingi TaxID=43151 RepID=A0A2M4DPZ0_ANODA
MSCCAIWSCVSWAGRSDSTTPTGYSTVAIFINGFISYTTSGAHRWHCPLCTPIHSSSSLVICCRFTSVQPS